MHYNKIRKVLHRTAVLADFFEYQGRLLAEELSVSNEKAKQLIEEKVYKGLEPFFDNLKPYPYIKETFEKLNFLDFFLSFLSLIIWIVFATTKIINIAMLSTTRSKIAESLFILVKIKAFIIITKIINEN